MVVIAPPAAAETGSWQETHGGAVEVNGAGAAHADTAAVFGADQAEVVAQDPKHRGVGRCLHRVRPARSL